VDHEGKLEEEPAGEDGWGMGARVEEKTAMK